MSTRASVLIPVLGAMLLHLGAAGCYPPIPEPPAPVSGYSWCVYADPARGLAGNVLRPITDPVSGLWMSACTCYCPEDHAVVLAGVNGTLVAGSEAETFYVEQLALLRTAAEIACLQRALEVQMELGTTLDFDAPGAVSCQAAVADEVPQSGGECPFDETQCQDGATAGLETHGPASTTAGNTGGTSDERGDAADTTGAPETATTAGDVTGTGTGGSGSDTGGVMIDTLRRR